MIDFEFVLASEKSTDPFVHRAILTGSRCRCTPSHSYFSSDFAFVNFQAQLAREGLGVQRQRDPVPGRAEGGRLVARRGRARAGEPALSVLLHGAPHHRSVLRARRRSTMSHGLRRGQAALPIK